VRQLNWKTKEYETWDDAFHGLVPAVRQQSVRVAAYTQALFDQACETPFGSGNAYQERICQQNSDLAYKCGLYHQLGKAMVPPEYQVNQLDFTDGERAVFRKYPTEGRLLVTALQERGSRANRWRRSLRPEKQTKNIPWLMIRESCQQHMERWNGGGYPDGLNGDAISPIAQIVGLAHELDALASGIKSEDAFGEAIAALESRTGKDWNPELIAVLKQAQPRCHEIFEKYIQYTKACPKTIPLVEKRSNRPMGLQFYPMVDSTGVVAYEAAAWFKLPEKTDLTAELAEHLERADMVENVSEYFLYEAADAAIRAANCTLPLRWIMLDMIPSFYAGKELTSLLDRLHRDQPLGNVALLLTIPAERVLHAKEDFAAFLQSCRQNGLDLVLDGFQPGQTSCQRLEDHGFRYLRLDAAFNQRPETVEAVRKLSEAGFTVLANGADTPEIKDRLLRCGVFAMTGALTGGPVSEEQLIQDCLLRERQHVAIS
jgi:EAL domain-containing protein (putative c-di-GMP-specific phosphodiesterase class I)